MARTRRDEDISKRPAIKKRLEKVFDDAQKGFESQRQRADEIIDNWEAYNCKLGTKQFYTGNTKIYVPIIKVAVDARRTRFINQMFPQNGRYVEVTSFEDELPLQTVALLEHYIRQAKIRTQAMPALLVTGDIEGQYNAYIHWDRIERHVVSRETSHVHMGGVEIPELGEIEVITHETITDELPVMEVVSDLDVCVTPVTVDTIDQALEMGGSVNIARRWTKTKIEEMARDGEILSDQADYLKEAMSKFDPDRKDLPKQLAAQAGIYVNDSVKVAVVLETWTKLKVDGERRLCRAYFGAERRILGCKLNPYWCDKVPLLSAPVQKVPGLFKGRSPINAGVMDLQVLANDAINEAMDSMAYSLAPLTAVDPEAVNRWESLVLDVGAVWPVKPEAVKEMRFTPVAADAMGIVAAAKAQIFEALGVNPAMLPQQTGRPGSKRNQAEVALEQQVDLLTTSDAVTLLENEILTPYVQRALEYDAQFRTKDLRVRMFGEYGQQANMQLVSPVQMNNIFTVVWNGVEAARNAAAIQNKIAFFGVLRGLPPSMFPGHRINAIPLLEEAVETIFGAKMGSKIFENTQLLYTVGPEQENQMLMQGFAVKTHPLDDDPKHIQVHMEILPSLSPDSPEYANAKGHIQQHQQAMQLKAIAAMQQQQPQRPQIGGPAPVRQIQPGAQPGRPRGVRTPGMIHKDRLPAAGAVQMPRKM